jgi:hypothetical protein
VLFGSDRLVKEGETVKRTGEIVSGHPKRGFCACSNCPRSMSPSAPSCSAVSSTPSVTPSTARAPSTPRRSAVPSSRPPAFSPAAPSTSPCRPVSSLSTPWCPSAVVSVS